MSYPDLVTINITARDIEQGIRHECQRCPAARAFGRKIRRWLQQDRNLYVSVNAETVCVKRQHPFTGFAQFVAKYETSYALAEFIRSYDDSRANVSPQTFKLRKL